MTDPGSQQSSEPQGPEPKAVESEPVTPTASEPVAPALAETAPAVPEPPVPSVSEPSPPTAAAPTFVPGTPPAPAPAPVITEPVVVEPDPPQVTASGLPNPHGLPEIAVDRPEVALGAAFGGGLLLAMILKRLAR